MWAIVDIKTRQYKVKEGDSIAVDYLGEDKNGTVMFLDKVLIFCNGDSIQIGQPYVAHVRIQANVEGAFKDKKVTSFTYKRRKGYMRKRGHRQLRSRLKILKIENKA